MHNNLTVVYTKSLQDEMKYDGKTVLKYTIECPVLSSEHYQITLKKINDLHLKNALETEKFFRENLYNDAVDQYKYNVANNYPTKVLEGLVTYTITYNACCIISLYFDQYVYSGGAHGSTIRTAETWNLQSGSKLKLSELYKCSHGVKSYILSQVSAQIKKDPEPYFDNYDELIEKYYNENNFYCTPDGVIFFYQQIDIAPYSSGIREFLIPYDDCLIDPKTKCFLHHYNINYNK